MPETIALELPGADTQPTTPPDLTGHEAQVVCAALSTRAERLEKMAKTAEVEGYRREARTFKGDTDLIRERILPAFREQQELPLAGPEEMRAALANLLRRPVETARRLKQEDEQLLSALAYRVDLLARELASRAFHAGVMARDNEPELLTLRAVEATAGQVNRTDLE